MSVRQDFWSRRRAEVALEAELELANAEAQTAAEESKALEEQSDEEILIALELPDPDTLEHGDDFSVFMAKAVPDRIRRRALRTLWLSNPVLANVDQLVDYGEDFTDSATVVENLQTAYQVGKGMLKHVEEMARQAAAADDDVEQDLAHETDLADVAFVDDSADEALDDEPLEAEDDRAEALEQDAEDEAVVVATPRRMKFRVEEVA